MMTTRNYFMFRILRIELTMFLLFKRNVYHLRELNETLFCLTKGLLVRRFVPNGPCVSSVILYDSYTSCPCHDVHWPGWYWVKQSSDSDTRFVHQSSHHERSVSDSTRIGVQFPLEMSMSCSPSSFS
jgi:hypothetical protein